MPFDNKRLVQALDIIVECHPELTEYKVVLAINQYADGSYLIQVLDLDSGKVIVTEHL